MFCVRAWRCFAAWTAVVCVAGCTSEESTPRSTDALEQTVAQTRDEQSEITATVTTPEKQDESPGLKIGEKAPAFELQDQNGQNCSLAEILKSGSAALVFYRSADW